AVVGGRPIQRAPTLPSHPSAPPTAAPVPAPTAPPASRSPTSPSDDPNPYAPPYPAPSRANWPTERAPNEGSATPPTTCPVKYEPGFCCCTFSCTARLMPSERL